MQEILLEISILKEDYQKALKKLILFFLSNRVPFDEKNYKKKQRRLRASGESLFRLQNKFRKVALLVLYEITKFDDII